MSDQRIWHKKAVWILSKQRLLNPPLKGSIIFVGSSIFRLWATLESDMNPLPVYNQAFGGARTWEVLHYADKLIIPHQPKIIVYYCGSNDISAGEEATAIRQRFEQFVEYIGKHLAKTRIFFVSINRVPEKQNKWHIVDAANTSIKSYCVAKPCRYPKVYPLGQAYRTPKLEFIDVNPALFDESGAPRLDLYMSDLIHLRPRAYQEFTKIIKPILEDAW